MYNKIMDEFLPYNGEFGKFESYTYTRSYINRHHTHLHKLGVFRWRGMQEYLPDILPLVSDPAKIVVDLGGAGCPLGFQSIIVDKQVKDATGKIIQYHSLTHLKSKVDVIFASHVFEHIKDLESLIVQIKDVLVKNGTLICMVPSFSNKFWNAGIHDHKVFGQHVWTIGLSETDKKITGEIPHYIDIDTLIGKYLQVEKATYCGDDSIFILAVNK